MKTRLFAVLVVLAGVPTTTALAQDDGQPDIRRWIEGRSEGSQTISIDVENADLADVMELIGRQVNANILVDPSVKETVTLPLHDVPWREAVNLIAKMTRCEVEERPGGVLLLTQPPKVTIQFNEASVRTVLRLLAAYSGKNIVISPDVEGTITLDLKKVHWLRALKAIVKTAGPYEVVPESDDLLRVVHRDTIRQQLETQVFTLSYVRPPANYRAVPPSTANAGNTTQASVFIGRVQTTAAQNVEETFALFRALQRVIEASNIDGSTLEYDDQTNAFIITATRPLIEQIATIIKKVDIEPAQVYAEVRFVSTRDNNNTETGVDWTEGSIDQGLRWSTREHGPFPAGRTVQFPPIASTGPSGGAPAPGGQPALGANPTGFDQSGAPNAYGLVDQNVGEYPFFIGEGTELFSELFRIPAILDFEAFNIALNLIDRDDRSRVVQSPSLFMLDNQDAVIFVGEQVPYAEVTATPDINGNVTRTIEEGDRSPVSIGFSLFIQPHVIPNSDRITLTVIPRVNELTGTTSTVTGLERFAAGDVEINLPRTREQALVTHCMLDDTSTAVLGGLLTERDVEIVKKVPILSSVPILGNLFTNKDTRKQLENLTIFITPTIVRPAKRTVLDSIFMRATRRLERADYFYRKYEAPYAAEQEAEELDEDD